LFSFIFTASFYNSAKEPARKAKLGSFMFSLGAEPLRNEEPESEKQTEWQVPSEEEIRKRAYELYLDRVRECGGSLDDWLEAEAELLLRPSGSLENSRKGRGF
jgi:hypothetical protein